MSIVGLGWGRATRTATLSESVRGDAPGVSVGGLAAAADDAPTVGDPDPGAGSDPEDSNATGATGTTDAADANTSGPKPIGDEGREEIPRASELFEPATTARVILLQNVVPAIATVAAYLVFRYVPGL